MELATYQLATAVILLVLACGLAAWRLYRKDVKPEAVTAIAVVSFLGALCFAISGVFYSPEQSDRLQGILYTVRAIPYDVGLIALSWFMIQSIGKKYPRSELLLSTAPGVFLVCWVSAFAVAIAHPMPALEEYSNFSLHFLLLKARNIPELIYPMLSGFVFLRELSQKELPGRILRLQNASFLIASLGFTGLVSVAMYVNVLKVLVESSAERAGQIGFSLLLESVFLAVAAAGWIGGAILDYSEDEREQHVQEIDEWIRLRHEIETGFDAAFGERLVLGRGLGNDTATARYYQACEHLGGPSYESLSAHDQEKGEKLFMLLGLLSVERDSARLAYRLWFAQDRLRNHSEFASALFVKMDASFRYDIRNDALFEAIEPALTLYAAGRDDLIHLRNYPYWVQLSALLAMDVGFLSSNRGGVSEKSNQPSPYLADEAVLSAYRRARVER